MKNIKGYKRVQIKTLLEVQERELERMGGRAERDQLIRWLCTTVGILLGMALHMLDSDD